MGGSATATTARGGACRGTLGVLECRVRAVDDDACDMSTRERERGLSRPQASNGRGTTGGKRRRRTGGLGR